MSEIEQGELENTLDSKGDQPECTPYDFSKPAPFLKDQARTLRLIHESFAMMAAAKVTTFLRSEWVMDLEDIEMQPFQQFMSSRDGAGCFAVLDMLPLNGQAILQAENNLLHAIVNRMMGGKGQQALLERGFTELELSVIEKFYKVMLPELRSAWSNLIDVTFDLANLEKEISFARVVSTQELCAVLTFKVEFGNAQGIVTLCIPYLFIKPIAGKLAGDATGTAGRGMQSRDVKEALNNHFRSTDIEVRAVLGDVDLSLADVLLLSPGDVLPLEQRVRDPIKVLVEGTPKLTASPGLKGKNRAVQVRTAFSDDQ